MVRSGSTWDVWAYPLKVCSPRENRPSGLITGHSVRALMRCWDPDERQPLTTHLVVHALGLDLVQIRAKLRVLTSGYLLATWEKTAQRADAGNPLILLVSALGLEPRTL